MEITSLGYYKEDENGKRRNYIKILQRNYSVVYQIGGTENYELFPA